MNESNKDVSKPEIGFVIASVGLSSLAFAFGYNSESIIENIISLVIFFFAIWGSSIFYWHILFEKIPSTMELWNNKGFFSFKGHWWIFKRWIKKLYRTAVRMNNNYKNDTLECGYLTILAVLYMYWTFGFILYIVKLIHLFKIIE